MKAQKNVGLLVFIALLAVAGIGYLVLQKVQEQTALYQQQLVAMQVEYDGKINATWVNEVPEGLGVTGGKISADGKKLGLEFDIGDVVKGANKRDAYMKITIDGAIKTITISGDQVNENVIDVEAVQLEPSEYVVYTDDEDFLPTVQSVVTVEDFDEDEFEIRIDVDTSKVGNTPGLDEIYVYFPFKLAKEPDSTVSTTKVWDIKVEAEEADSDYDEVDLEVYAAYNTSVTV